MKPYIENLLREAVKKLQDAGRLPDVPDLIQVDATKDKQHGDYASNIALVLAKAARQKPREVAALIISEMASSPVIQKIDIAGPGFINFFLSPDALTEIVKTILKEKRDFGRSKVGRNKQVLLEFVSSNPTGPLHVGHGRHAAFGDVVANLLDAVGFNVSREYYVNDAGRQMDILAVSVWTRYLVLLGEEMPFPANGYQGDYVLAIAKTLQATYQDTFLFPTKAVLADLPKDEAQGGDKEIYIDALVQRAKALLGKHYQTIFDLALDNILADIREDLSEFGVTFDKWYSERDNVTEEVIDKLLTKLREGKHLYDKEGALWFRSTDFGDEKDRVMIRSNGVCTYFANDFAYHLSKFERNFDIAIDLFGSDHHGYMLRMKAAMQSMGINPERLVYLLMQFVSLYRNNQPVQMSTRGGKFVTLRELREEVGNDAARFFYVMRKHEQPIDFDLDLAKKQSNENPVYYVQYAHARISSVLKQLAERNITYDEKEGLGNLALLISDHERELLNTLASYPDMIVNAAIHYEPHQLTQFLRDLATDFHAYYNAEQFIVADSALRNARLSLVMAVKQTLLNGFNLLGISAPENM